jgi:hypothetical protein
VTLRGGAVLVGQGPGATTECISDASVQVATDFNISSLNYGVRFAGLLVPQHVVATLRGKKNVALLAFIHDVFVLVI